MSKLRPYLVWGVAAMFSLYQFALQASVGVFAPEIQRDLNATAASIGVLTALFSVSYAMMQIPVGILLDRFSPRWLMSASLAVCATGALVFAYTPDLLGAGFGRLLMGLGASFGFVGASFLAGRWLPPARFALFVGLTEALSVGGAAGFDALDAVLESHVSWRDLIFYTALFGYGLTVLLWLVVRDYPPGAKPQTKPRGESLAVQAGHLVTNSQLWFASVFYFLSMGTLLGFAGLWNVPFQLSFGLNQSQVAMATSLIFIGWALGSPFAGWLSDLTGRRKLILLVGVIGHFLIMVAILYTKEIPMSVIYSLRLLLGFFGGMNILAFSVAADHAPCSLRGTALGIINTAGFAGVTILQVFPGFLIASQAHADNHYIGPMSVYLIALIFAATAVIFLSDRKPKRDEPIEAQTA